MLDDFVYLCLKLTQASGTEVARQVQKLMLWSPSSIPSMDKREMVCGLPDQTGGLSPGFWF